MEGAVHQFGVSGKLTMNGMLMFDRETDTLWSHITGEAFKGPLKGAQLSAVPVTHTRWREWVDQHPDTKVLDKRGSYGFDSYYQSSRKGVLGSTRNDPRLGPKELLVGLRGQSGAKAYSFSALADQQLINDSFEERSLLVLFDEKSQTGQIYDRTVDGQTRTLELLEGDTALRDAETGTTWDRSTLEATDGPLTGATLQLVPTTYSFWFGWSDYYPTTLVYGEFSGSSKGPSSEGPLDSVVRRPR
jgi:hypothetical protein